MPAYKNAIDHIINSRGCNPYHHKSDGTCVYELQNNGDGPFIRDWTPPDPVSYGAQPTEAEIAAVSEADCATAQQAYRVAHATLALTKKDYALVEAVAAATSVNPDDLLADYIQRLADAE
jgi:hypothetical protein